MRVILLCALAVLAIGCGSSGGGELDQNYLKNAEQLGTQRREIFVRANGNYESMSAEDKAAYLKTFDGNEEHAKKFWDLMKNPPSSSLPSGVNFSGPTSAGTTGQGTR